MSGDSELHVPADERAERATLGAILADPDCYQRAAAVVDGADFHNDAHGRIFDACRALAETGIAPDLVTIPDQLERDGALALVGGVAYVASLAEGLPDPANVEHYAAIVRACARKRRLLFLGQRLAAEAAGSNGGGLAAVQAELVEALAEGTDPDAPAFADIWRQADVSDLTNPPRRRQWLLTLPETQGGHGVLPRGKPGILAAEGGTGKTNALVTLGLCIVTGRLWFGHYVVPATVTGRVLLALAEEDAEDRHRRLWTAAEALGLTAAERAECAERIVVLPLAGRSVTLTAAATDGLRETTLAAALRTRLTREPGEDGWALIGLDPLSRFAGGDVEGDNESATRFVEVLESLAAVPGHPTVLVSAHSSKVARRQGQADVRGVTGLSDAARWVGTMRREGEEVVFAVVKSNYGLPAPPLRLRWRDGVLDAVSGAEILAAASAAQAAQSAEIDEDVRRVVDVLSREGVMTSRDAIAHAAGLRLARGRAAIDLAIARGVVKPSGTARRPRYEMGGGGVCSRDPHTPGTAGTASQALRQTPSGLFGTGTGRDGTGGRAGADSDPSDGTGGAS